VFIYRIIESFSRYGLGSIPWYVSHPTNDSFLEWLEQTYGDPNIGEVKATRRKRHEYLGMTLDYTTPGQVKVSMIEYIKSMINSFSEDTGNKTVHTP
jgi:hypothetical protein